jgi:serine/threonine-protein kinase
VADAEDRYIGPYRILGRIGAGGMGEVFRAYDARLHRDVALKAIKPTDGADPPIDAARLRDEARAAARLNHPNIAAIYDVLETAQGPCIVMEYVEGETLAQRLARGPMTSEEAMRLGGQLAAALAAAHEHGVVHRDVKPGNIQVTPDGRLKLLDLGVAKGVQPQPSDTTTLTPDTGTTVRKGTPGYMAPEQLRFGAVGPYTDVYAAGLVLFEMLAGRRVFASRDLVGIAMEMASQPTTDVQRFAPSAPPALCAVVRKALQLNPSDRFHDGTELSAALAAASAPPARRWLPRVSARMAAALGLAAIGVLTVAGLLTFRRPPSDRPPLGEPAVVALLPVLGLSPDEPTAQLASALSLLLIHNLAALPNSTVTRWADGVRVRSRDRDGIQAAADSGITRFVDLALQQTGASYRLDARILGPGGEPLWRDRFEGDSVSIQRQLLDALGHQAAGRAGSGATLSQADRGRLTTLATGDIGALAEYVRAKAVLEAPNAAARIDEAATALEGAVAADQRFVPALGALADAYRLKFQRTSDQPWLEKAGASARAALAADPSRADGHLALAGVLNAEGRAEDAIAEYRTAISLQPSLDDAHRQLGRLLAQRGQMDDAVAELNRAVALRPDYWANHYTLAISYFGFGRYREAVTHLRRVTELQPNYGAAYSALGVIHHRQGDLPQAIGYYEHATRVDGSATAHSNLGTVYYESGRHADALAAYQKAAGLDPTSPITYRNIGDAYSRLGDPGAAAKAYEEAIALTSRRLVLNPRDAFTIALMALCEAKVGRHADARRHAAEAVVVSPVDREVVYKQAAVLAIVGEARAALDSLRRAIERGYERRWARTDDDLRSIRDLPEFKQLTADPTTPRGGFQ